MTCCCDVGGTYEPEKQRFDHHQRSFEEIWRKGDAKLPEIKLSSAGLIYRHFGHEIIKNAVKGVWDQDMTEDQVNWAHEKMYKKFILEVDANDNGVSVNEHP